MNRNDAWGRAAAMAVLPCLVLAGIGFGVALPEFSHLRHPLALLGARGVPHATGFDLLGFVLPGLLAAYAAVIAFPLTGDGRGWGHRIGVQLLFLSGLAFAGMGLLPLDPADLDGPESQRHAAAWLLWAVAFVPGAVALGAGIRARARGLAWLCLAVAALVAVCAFVPGLPPALSQRIAFAAWAAWFGVAAGHWPRAQIPRG
ncbi:MAG TPA: DUF998 domain-containing protein [Stenotrophomonas sp.]|jgi:hypothetical protein